MAIMDRPGLFSARPRRGRADNGPGRSIIAIRLDKAMLFALILPTADHFKQFTHPKMHNLLLMRQQLCLEKFRHMLLGYLQYMAHLSP